MPDPDKSGLPPSSIVTSEGQGQDITDVHLPSLSSSIDGDDESTQRHFGQHVSRPPDPMKEGAPAPDQIDAIADGGDLHPKKRRPLQERIDTLVRKRHEADEANAMLSAQIQELVRVNQTLQQQIAANLRPGQPAPRRQAGDDLLGDLGSGPPNQPETGVGPALPLDLEGTIARSLRNYDNERRNEEAALARLQASQRQSFGVATEEYPDLGDPRSQAGKLFAQIWDSSPLRGDPNGPWQVALMVKGLMADETPSREAQAGALEQRKRQVSVVAPQGQPAALPGSTAATQLKAQYVAALKRFRDSHDPGAYAEARKIQAKMRQITQQQQ